MQLLIVLPERMPDQHFASVGIFQNMVQGAQVHCKSLRLFISNSLSEINSAGSIDGEYRPGA
jgi:hypothetical protein